MKRQRRQILTFTLASTLVTSLVTTSAGLWGSTLMGAPSRVSVGADLWKIWKETVDPNASILDYYEDVVLMEVDSGQLDRLSEVAHAHLKRCGGFMVESPHEVLLQSLRKPATSHALQSGIYDISNQQLVNTFMEHVSGTRLFERIAQLSSYPNRYYKSSYGEASQKWVLEQWRKLASENPGYSVREFQHKGWGQPSIILTIRGATLPHEIIVIGGHGDSKAPGTGDAFVAPGADDNASGIAGIMEIASVLAYQKFYGERTIELISYAAEEVGLLGSSEIAESYKSQSLQVIGVMQLDMINFNGSAYNMVLMSDYTSKPQNQFLEALISEYLPQVTYSYDKCGYACSDHASWFRRGFPTSIPFEATLRTKNPYIHTKNDTMTNSNQDPELAANFVKLGLAYGVELSL